jgi:hypothetical protein
MEAVRKHLDACPRPHLELNEMGEVMPCLAIAPQPLEPPAWLRESVMAAAQADLAARRRIARPLEAVTSESRISVEFDAEPEADTRPNVRVIPLARVGRSRRRVAATWLSRVAAAAVLVGLGSYAFVVQGDLSKAKQDQEHAKAVLNVIGQQGSRTVMLTDVHASGAGGTVALLPSGHIVVWLNHLPTTHNDEIYTVWLTGGDGVQVKVGSFYPEADGTGFLEVDNVSTSATLWISVGLEPGANVVRPTGPSILSGILSL